MGLGGFEELGVVSVVLLGVKSYRGKGEKRPSFRKRTGSDKTEIKLLGAKRKVCFGYGNT